MIVLFVLLAHGPSFLPPLFCWHVMVLFVLLAHDLSVLLARDLSVCFVGT